MTPIQSVAAEFCVQKQKQRAKGCEKVGALKEGEVSNAGSTKFLIL